MAEHRVSSHRHGDAIRPASSGEVCDSVRWLMMLSRLGSLATRSAMKLDVDHLVNEVVGTLGKANEVVARPGVAAEHRRPDGSVEAIRKGGKHRRMLDQDGSDADTVVVEWVDLDGIHRR